MPTARDRVADPGPWAGVTTTIWECLQWLQASQATCGGLGTLGAESGGPCLQEGAAYPSLGQ